MCRSRVDYVLLCALAVAPTALAAAQDQPVSPRLERGLARDLACSPQAPLIKPTAAITVGAGQKRGKALFAAGDTVIVNAGRGQGLSAGQQYFVRRVVSDRFTEPFPGYRPISVHTAGWVRIVDVQADAASAIVTHACDGIMDGDYLDTFEMPMTPSPARSGEPDFGTPAHIILADERRQMAGPGELMVVDRGSDHGLQAGHQLTIFRYGPRVADPVLRVGSATAVIIRPQSAVMRIDRATDAVYVGDLVAVQR
ncbi:MAG: hypothetical protein LC753_14900 [Acidobacteria bacterium]|nr:hypothetical protein [Acidobacteriota bacterium]